MPGRVTPGIMHAGRRSLAVRMHAVLTWAAGLSAPRGLPHRRPSAPAVLDRPPASTPAPRPRRRSCGGSSGRSAPLDGSRRDAAVMSATVLGRGVALLRSRLGDGDGRIVERIRTGYAVPLDAIAVDPRRYVEDRPARGALPPLPGCAAAQR